MGLPDQSGSGGEGGAGGRELVAELASSARRSGRRAVLSGRWLADTVVDIAPRVPVRDTATLAAHHDGLTGPALARAVVRSSGRVSAGAAAATGTLITAQQLSVATVVLVPFELAAMTAAVVLNELKLIAELHHVAGRPLAGGPLQRSQAGLLIWASGHAVGNPAPAPPPDGPGAPDPGRPDRGSVGLSRPARRELGRALRGRFGRNLSAVGPMMTGAVAAGVLNRQSTVRLGRALSRDLGLGR